MSGCSGNCSTCGSDCSDRKAESMLAKLNEKASVKKVIAVVSGKGGVGKSTVTAMTAVAMARKGKRVAVLDADITGPSAPTAFGVTECQGATKEGLYPALTRGGIQVMSINLLLDNSTDPVVWRGPVIAGAVKQFWTDVIWEDVDYMFVDMPPGTGDVPLTVFQSLPVDGIIIVTSPQDLVSMIVTKAVKMANMMHIPVLGFVENYSFLECPDCGKRIEVFGKSHLEDVAKEFINNLNMSNVTESEGEAVLLAETGYSDDTIVEYTEPIEINEGTVVYAFAVDKDGNISTISVFEFGYYESNGEEIEDTYVIEDDCIAVVLPKMSAKPGETVTVPVELKNNPGFTNLSLILGYDAEKITLDEVKNGDVFEDADFDYIANEDGSCKFTWKPDDVNEKDGILVNLTFTVGQNVSDESV